MTASVSFLRILLKEATCHAVREPELTTLRGEREREREREREILASPQLFQPFQLTCRDVSEEAISDVQPRLRLQMTPAQLLSDCNNTKDPKGEPPS